jgi:hypothetical protein
MVFPYQFYETSLHPQMAGTYMLSLTIMGGEPAHKPRQQQINGI